MANLKFPYEGGGYLTVSVDEVYQVERSGATLLMYYDIPMAAGEILATTLTYETQNPTDDDITALEAAVLNASQKPGSCDIFRLIGDDGTVGYQLDVANAIACASAAEV